MTNIQLRRTDSTIPLYSVRISEGATLGQMSINDRRVSLEQTNRESLNFTFTLSNVTLLNDGGEYVVAVDREDPNSGGTDTSLMKTFQLQVNPG